MPHEGTGFGEGQGARSRDRVVSQQEHVEQHVRVEQHAKRFALANAGFQVRQHRNAQRGGRPESDPTAPGRRQMCPPGRRTSSQPQATGLGQLSASRWIPARHPLCRRALPKRSWLSPNVLRTLPQAGAHGNALASQGVGLRPGKSRRRLTCTAPRTEPVQDGSTASCRRPGEVGRREDRLRNAAARSRDALWRAVGEVLDEIDPRECADRLGNAGHCFNWPGHAPDRIAAVRNETTATGGPRRSHDKFVKTAEIRENFLESPCVSLMEHARRDAVLKDLEAEP